MTQQSHSSWGKTQPTAFLACLAYFVVSKYELMNSLFLHKDSGRQSLTCGRTAQFTGSGFDKTPSGHASDTGFFITADHVKTGPSEEERFPTGIRLRSIESPTAEKNPIGQNQSENQSG